MDETTLSSIMSAILRLDKKLDTKIDKLEDKIDKIHLEIDTKVKDAVTKAMGVATNDIKNDFEKKVTDAKAELTNDVTVKLKTFQADWEESQRRITNLFLYDTPERGDGSQAEQEGWDCAQITGYIELLNLDVTTNCHSQAAGPRRPGLPAVTVREHQRVDTGADKRPIKLVLNTMYERDLALRAEAKLFREGKIPKRRLTRDYTKSEREKYKQLKDELKKKEEIGEKDWYITRNYELAKKNPRRPFRGNPRDNTAGDPKF